MFRNKKDITAFLAMNKPFAAYLHSYVVDLLQDEEQKLKTAAETALLDSSVRDSAICQLGRVSLLREADIFLTKAIGE